MDPATTIGVGVGAGVGGLALVGGIVAVALMNRKKPENNSVIVDVVTSNCRNRTRAQCKAPCELEYDQKAGDDGEFVCLNPGERFVKSSSPLPSSLPVWAKSDVPDRRASPPALPPDQMALWNSGLNTRKKMNIVFNAINETGGRHDLAQKIARMHLNLREQGYIY